MIRSADVPGLPPHPPQWLRRFLREHRTGFVLLMVLMTLLPVGLLAHQAYRASGSQRAVAETVMQDYALMAAREFSSRVWMDLGYEAIFPVVNLVHRSELIRSLPRCASLDGYPDLIRDLVVNFFRLDRPKRSLELSDRRFDTEETRWLVELLAAEDARTPRTEQYYRLVVGTYQGRQRFFACRGEENPERVSRYLYGFELDGDQLCAVFDKLIARQCLLPAPLAKRLVSPDVAAVTLRAADGTVVYQTPEHRGAVIRAADKVGSSLPGLEVEVALPTDVADELVIGGLPGSRLPAILALLCASIILVAATVLLLRKEQELGRIRSDFVANVSHELRTPLSQIRLFAETLLLRRVRSPDEVQRSLEVIHKEVRRLTHHVENVLQFSRTERSKLPFKPELRRPAELIREVLDSFRPFFTAYHMKVRVNLPDVDPVPVDVDAFRRILMNLLDNAVKYGPAGQTLRVLLGSSVHAVQIAVEDEGPGVEPHDRVRIFDRYFRARAPGAAVAGTGIGLYLVRTLAERHGGRCWVTSRAGGRGARFVVELPRNGMASSLHGTRSTVHRRVGGPR